jgi:hypothetical protein
MKAIVKYIWIIKQEVILFPKFKKNQKETIISTLTGPRKIELC